MRPITHALLGIAGLIAAGGAGFWYGLRAVHAPAPETAGATAPANATGERAILYYRNPMGLPDTSPVPKKDSMGMDYIPVYAGDEPSDSGVVKINPARVQTIGVKTALAEERVIEATVRAVGRIEVNERAIVDVAPKFDGWIERLHVNATGDPVRKGQPLFTVYSPELVSAQKELRIAEGLQASDPTGAAAEGAKRLAAAARERLRNWDIGALPREGNSDRLVFPSPASGIVLEKNAIEGMRFMPGNVVYRIADLRTVWAIADIYEQDLSRVAVGEQATVTLDAFPGRSFDARIDYLYPTVNPATRTTPIRVEIVNPEGMLRPGMFAHIELGDEAQPPRVTVPSSALIETGSRQIVLLALGEGRFKPQPVSIGRRGREHVEILDGVAAGDRVVVAANFLIDAESNLRAALANFSDPEAETPAVPRYEARGAIEEIDLEELSASVTHEPIAALQWPAMTMDFALDSAEVVSGVEPGAPMHFEFEQRGPGEFVITRITPEGGAR